MNTSRFLAGLLALCALVSCSHPPMPPVSPPPVWQGERPQPPPLPASVLTLPLAVPLATLQAMVEQAAVLPSAPEWQRVTADGQSPEVDVRYQARIERVEIGSEHEQLTGTVHIAYHGELRARAKTPFGWIWLTRGTRWGTAHEPGRIQVRVQTRLRVSERWQLTSRSRLRQIELIAPPMKKLCTSGLFKLCIPASQAERHVHAELKRRVRAEVQSALAQADRRVPREVPLRHLAERVWRRLQQPAGELTLAPEALAAEPPRVRDGQLVVPLRVRARPRWTGARPRPVELPGPGTFTPKADRLHFELPLTLPALEQQLQGQLRSLPQSERGARVSRVRIHGADRQPGRLWIETQLTLSETEHAAYFSAVLAPEGASLALQGLRASPPSRALLEAAGFAPGQLESALEQLQLSADAPLRRRVGQVRRALASSVSPLPVRALEGMDAQLDAPYVDERGLVVQVVVQ